MGRSFTLTFIRPGAIGVCSAARAAHPGLKSGNASTLAVHTDYTSKGPKVFAAPEKIPERKGKHAKRKEAEGYVGVEGEGGGPRHPDQRLPPLTVSLQSGAYVLQLGLKLGVRFQWWHSVRELRRMWP
jgi:hypothetical protein